MGGVNGRVRNITEKRFVLVAIDKIDGGIGYGVSNDRLAGSIGDMGHGFVSLNPRQGRVIAFRITRNPHVIGIGNSLVFIKALGKRHEGRLVPEVPFAEATGGIACLFQDFGDGDFLGV